MHIPRKLATTVVGLAVVATIATGCKTENTATPLLNSTPSPTTVAAAPAATEQPADDSGVTDASMLVLLWETQDIYGVTETQADRFATAVCDRFDAGATWQEVAMIALGADSDYTPTQLGYMVGSSVQAYCPEHSDEIG